MAAVYRRGKTWWVRFRIDGEHVRQSARTTRKPEAVAYLQKMLREHTGRARGDVPRKRYEEALERFFVEATISPKTRTGYRTSASALAKHLNGKLLDQIDRRLIGEFVSARKRGGVTDTSIRRDLAFLSSLCSMAVRWGWLDLNPVKTFDKRTLKESRPRTRFLTDHELARLLDAASPHVRDPIELAVETGLRREEQFSLEWRQIDWARKEIVLERTKTGAPRRVPLSPRAEDILLRLHAERRPVSTFVHDRPDGRRYVDLHRGFQAACRRAGITNLRWHDLRHTYASWFVQNGGELYHLSRILGHTTLAMTTRYGHLRTADLHDAVRRVAQNRSHQPQWGRSTEPPPHTTS